jgi:hypothetical protein
LRRWNPLPLGKKKNAKAFEHIQSRAIPATLASGFSKLNNPISIGESLELFATHERMDVSMAAEFNSPGFTPQTFQDDSGLLISRMPFTVILPDRSAAK